jgi:hypothetical protein
MQHSREHWRRMTLASQLGNVGSEYSRAVSNKNRNEARFISAQNRYLELLDLTINDPRWNVFRKRELLRLREISAQDFPGDLQKYFDQFAFLAR